MLYDRETGEPADLDDETAADIELELAVDDNDFDDDRPRRPYHRRPERCDDAHLIRMVRRVADDVWTSTRAYPATVLSRRLGLTRATLQRRVAAGDVPPPDVFLGRRPAYSEQRARAVADRLGLDFDQLRSKAVGDASPPPAWWATIKPMPAGRFKSM